MIIRHSSSTSTNINANTIPLDPASVQARIERSRLSRPLLRNLNQINDNNHSIQSSLPLYLARLALNESTNNLEVPTTTTVGPPPPASWTVNTKSTTDRKVRKNYLLGKSIIDTGSIESLGDIIARSIILDLLESRKDSLYLDLVKHLPVHLRLRLVDVAAESGIGLNERGIIALLLEDQHSKDEDRNSTEAVTPLELEEEGGGWEDMNILDWDDFSNSLNISLTTLNLAFTSANITFLTSFLLTPSSRRSIPTFPHLRNLLLPSTDNISLSDSSFHDLLAHLVSLRHLSLANKVLPLQQGHLSLIRIANSTPTLSSIDLSNCKNFDSSYLGKVDWNSNWLNLKRFILIISVEGKEEEEKIWEGLLRETIYLKMGKTKRWIDFK